MAQVVEGGAPLQARVHRSFRRRPLLLLLLLLPRPPCRLPPPAAAAPALAQRRRDIGHRHVPHVITPAAPLLTDTEESLERVWMS